MVGGFFQNGSAIPDPWWQASQPAEVGGSTTPPTGGQGRPPLLTSHSESDGGFDIRAAAAFPPPSHMQQLHAYWRMEYIEAPRYPAAMKRPFTDLPALGDDRAALIVHRSKLSYLLLNRFPYNPGHLLAVPFRDVADLAQLNAAERADLFDEVILGQTLLTAALKPDGFNVGFNLGSAVAGGSIEHLHGHIVPRWNGDNNFMPVLAQTRILPQSLDTTWEKLSAAAAALGLKKEEGKRKKPAPRAKGK